jgi:putative drug exporter of the RND superfamily
MEGAALERDHPSVHTDSVPTVEAPRTRRG